MLESGPMTPPSWGLSLAALMTFHKQQGTGGLRARQTMVREARLDPATIPQQLCDSEQVPAFSEPWGDKNT